MHIHFVTGRLAEPSLLRLLPGLAGKAQFEYSVQVLPITVAALMTVEWISKRLQVPPKATQVVIPGYCEGDLECLTSVTDAIVQRGPRDLRQLPDWFGQQDAVARDYGSYDIEILAEINHCPRLSRAETLTLAAQLRADGADVIDVGCDPGDPWRGVADCVKALRDDGYRVSIDSLNPAEIEPAVQAGAELVLSVNSTNRQHACDWGCEVVVIPDDVASLGGLDESVDMLARAKVPLRIDPVLEPIGVGLMASLNRYQRVRDRFPDGEMLMGIGNITELTDADSGPLNIMLLAICQELGIRSVLTTQVINWARTSVRECDLARRMVYYAVRHQSVAKHLEPDLVTLRDVQLYPPETAELDRLAREIRDHNYRLCALDGQIHLISSDIHLHDRDPFRLFEKLVSQHPQNIDPGHAFYLGFEMCKAFTALTLGKQYRQDDALDWGYLTVPEHYHRLKRSGGANPHGEPQA